MLQKILGILFLFVGLIFEKGENDMDIARFINSKDIREHLINIGYKFNSLEAAWLIFQCKSASIEEKHNAWNELIKTMPDCSIPERMNTVPQDSLHAFLKKYMELEDKLVNEFYDNKYTDTYNDYKPYVYKFEYIYKDGLKYDRETVFSCFDALYESIMEPDEDVVSIRCTKMQVDRLNSWQVAYLTPSFDILSLDPGRFENKDDEDIYWGVFEGLWFEFPTPFHKGDIVWDPSHPEGFCGGPFVMTDITPEFARESTRKDGDNTDMNAWGYFLNDDGRVYHEVMWNYMDLEFYRGELSGYRRILTAFSNYVKGEIDAALLCEGYHNILSEEDAKQKRPNIYTEKGLYLAGIRV